MLFSSLLQEVTGPECSVHITPDWSQGRSTFGGLVAAFVYQAMTKLVDSERLLLDISGSFIAPVTPSELKISARIIREGGSVTQIAGKAEQNGQVAVTMLATFGKFRESVLRASPVAMPEPPALEQCQKLPYIPNVTPEFVQHYDLHYAWGGMPFSGNQSRELGGWMRLTEEEPEINHAHLLGYIDAWPPATLPWIKKPCPASTLSWAVQFIQPTVAVKPREYCIYKADVEFTEGGYGFTRSHLWHESGALLALSQQTIAVFA